MDKTSLLVVGLLIFVCSALGGVMNVFSKKVAYPFGAVGGCLFLYAQFLCN